MLEVGSWIKNFAKRCTSAIQRIDTFIRSRGETTKWIALFLFLLSFVWIVPELQGKYLTQDVAAENRPLLVNEYRRTWAQIIGGFALLLGLYFTWRRIEISQQTLEATENQQVTERFTRAIEQLGAVDGQGNKNLELRLGGIYALERIASDSVRDYWPVIEVLTTYIRQHAPRDRFSTYFDRDRHKPTPDIEAILTVIGRRRSDSDVGRVSLRNLDLRGAALTDANFGKVDFQNTDFRGANFYKVNLSRALLRGEVDFEEAVFYKTKLDHVSIDEIEMGPLTFNESSLRYCSFYETDLQRVSFIGCNLEGASFILCNLNGVEFSDALFGPEVNLQGAYFGESDLTGADLSDANTLEQEQIEQALGDETTQLPPHLQMPASWRVNDTD